MAYDEQLADRARAVLSLRQGLSELKMFGGIAWMIAGNMACGVIGDELIIRVAAEDYERALAEPGARSSTSRAGRCAASSASAARRSPPKRASPAGSTRGADHAASLPAKGPA